MMTKLWKLRSKEAVATLVPPQTTSWADKARPGSSLQACVKAKGKGKQKGVGPQPARAPRFAVKINPSEWMGDPILSNLSKLEQALSQAEELPGNLIVPTDPEVITQAKSLWAAFGCKTKKLTVATVDNKALSSPSVCVWWKNPGKSLSGSQTRVQLQVTQIGTNQGPVPMSAVVTNIPKAKGSKMTTVRFLAPTFYRKFMPGVLKEDSPASVIGCFASSVGCQASLLTSGRWEVANHSHGRILIGHVKWRTGRQTCGSLRDSGLVYGPTRQSCAKGSGVVTTCQTRNWGLFSPIPHPGPS